MSFPQPSSVNSVLTGQKFFRLTTELESAGDIYESEVGALGFALGPNSDLASVNITYLDENAPGSVAQATISPDRSFIGRVNARNDSTYPGEGSRKGRILISPNDLYNASYRPALFDSDEWEQIPPTLDVIQYFTSAPSIVPPRSDKRYRYQYLEEPATTSNRSWLAIPAYGRKSGTFAFNNYGASTAVSYLIGAVTFAAAGNAPAGGGASSLTAASYTVALATGTAANNTSIRYQFKSSVDGVWDYFLIALGGSALTPYTGTQFLIDIALSDDLQ